MSSSSSTTTTTEANAITQSSSSSQSLYWWYPTYKGKPVYNGNPDALAWAMDSIGRAIQFVGAGAFFGTALLRIAKEAAGCETEPPPGETLIPECDETIYGIKPSSLLTTYTMIVGVSSASMLPLMGAIIDYTPYRLRVGQITSFIFCCLIFPQIFLTEDNFFAMAIIQVVVSFVGWTQTAITYAYLPELTDDELLLNDYTKSFTMLSFTAMVVYLAAVIGGVSVAGRGDDDVFTSQVGMGVAFCLNFIFLVPSWGFLFGHREAMHTLPEDKRLATAGFIQLWDTGKHIYKNYPALKWFYCSIAMSDAGLQALATIAITYLTDQLQFTARENGIAIMFMLIGSVPGAILSNVVTKKSDPVVSSQVALVVLIVSTMFFAIFLKGPDQHLETYVLACVWGLGSGWKWTCDRLVASSIIPEGQDAELMGLFLFSGQCLSWIPPLVFTAINEAGISQRVGVASLEAYFVLAMLGYFMMGGYGTAREQVNRLTTYASSSSPSSPTTTSTKEEKPIVSSVDEAATMEAGDSPTGSQLEESSATTARRKDTTDTEASLLMSEENSHDTKQQTASTQHVPPHEHSIHVWTNDADQSPNTGFEATTNSVTEEAARATEN